MPIPLPNLDDRTYGELTAEARALIPHLHPAWTDHNPGDPGIVLVELLAWLTEMLLYQVNQVPPASTEAFLGLLNGAGWVRPQGAGLDEAMRTTVRGLRERYRAVTPDDFEHLTLNTWPLSDAAGLLGDVGRIARAHCIPRRNLTAPDPLVRGQPAPAHVSLVVVPPAAPGAGAAWPEPPPELCTALFDFLGPRCTLTTRLHVLGPTYADVGVAANLVLHEDAPPGDALDAAAGALAAFFDPLTGGPDGTGWPFGRDVYASEVYAVLDQVSLVNYVQSVELRGPQPMTAGDDVVGIELDDGELVELTAIDLVAFDVLGDPHVREAEAT